MNIEIFRAYCLAKKAVTEGLPFGPTTLVFKVAGKMFALASLDEIALKVNLKCDPERAMELRERYDAIQPGYHMNKSHWNTLYCETDLEDVLIKELIDHSYALVVGSLKKKEREAWEL